MRRERWRAVLVAGVVVAGLAAVGAASIADGVGDGGGGEGAERDTGEGGEAMIEGVRLGDLVVVRTDDEVIEGEVDSIIEGEGGAIFVAGRSGVERATWDEIRSVEVRETAYRRYVEARLAIEDTDTRGILDLVGWLESRRMYETALQELDAILERDPANELASRERRVIVALMDMEARRARSEREGEGDEADADEDVERTAEGVPIVDGRRLRRPTREELPLLTPTQVNLMKVFEVDLEDAPRLRISDETIDRLLRRYADSPLIPSTAEGRRAFRRLDPAEILSVMFRLRARELYPEVEVIGNPSSMETFRDRVHTTWLVNRCATTRCHGGVDAGRFQLVNTRRSADQAVYTNFYIMDSYRPRAGIGRMIDWEDPARSLMLQMALPRGEAIFPHPEVRGWRPLFTNRDSEGFRDAVEWIESMHRPRPEYDLAYETPQERYDRERAAEEAEDGENGEAGEGGGAG